MPPFFGLPPRNDLWYNMRYIACSVVRGRFSADETAAKTGQDPPQLPTAVRSET